MNQEQFIRALLLCKINEFNKKIASSKEVKPPKTIPIKNICTK